MDITKEHAQAFLDSLWPCGDNAHLANHTRSYLSGLIGVVPTILPNSYSAEYCKRLADALIGIAEHLLEEPK